LSSSGMKASTASMSEDFPAAELDCTITASGARSLREVAAIDPACNYWTIRRHDAMIRNAEQA
jgi:hypothetical protein